jgi:hypothetical protein
MKEDRREQTEQSSEQVKFCKYDYWVDSDIVFFFFKRINLIALKKPFALILCLPATEHHVANSYALSYQALYLSPVMVL